MFKLVKYYFKNCKKKRVAYKSMYCLMGETLFFSSFLSLDFWHVLVLFLAEDHLFYRLSLEEDRLFYHFFYYYYRCFHCHHFCGTRYYCCYYYCSFVCLYWKLRNWSSWMKSWNLNFLSHYQKN